MEPFIPAMDPVSGMPLRNLTFILNRFLPTLLFHLETVIDLENSGHFEIISCGSFPEGFAVPLYFQVGTDEICLTAFDADYLYVDRRYRVITDIGMRSREKAIPLVLDTNECKVGFVRLRTETGDYFGLPELPKNKLRLLRFHNSFGRQGPAITIHSKQLLLYKSSIFPEKIERSADCVYALEYDQWPEAAAEWRTRERLSGWPSLDLIAELPPKGCHLIQKAHPESYRPEVEWRLSFSKIEVVLARSLSNVQRQCYVLFKLAVSLILKIDKSSINQQVLSTYHLKTVMFWICEETLASEFTETTIGERYLDLLDRLIDFLDEGFLPNYFVRDNNMISHIRLKVRQAIAEKLRFLRRYPTSAFIQFENGYVFLFSAEDFQRNIFLVFQELFYPNEPGKPKELYLKQGHIFVDFLSGFQSQFLNTNLKYSWLATLIDPYTQLLRDTNPSVDCFIEFSEKVAAEITSLSHFLSSLARYFLEKRLERELTKNQSEIWTKYIHQTFHLAMTKNVGTSVKDVLDYYSWLVFDKRMSNYKIEHNVDFLQQLQAHLGDVVVLPKVVQFDDVEFITYTAEDRYMLHDPLMRMQINIVGHITIPTKIYLCYLLVAREVISHGRNSPKTQRSVVEMKQVCGEYGHTDEAYVRYSAPCYGYSYTDSGKRPEVTVANMCYNFQSELFDFLIHT